MTTLEIVLAVACVVLSVIVIDLGVQSRKMSRLVYGAKVTISAMRAIIHDYERRELERKEYGR